MRDLRPILDHLAGLGHRRIAFIGIADRLADISARKGSYLTFMQRIGGDVHDGFIQDVIDHPSGGAEAVERLMRLSECPTAVFCSTDVLAIGAHHAAQCLGIRVPSDVSIVGFDDIAFAAYTVPSLTTVRMPTVEMARLAVQQALSPDLGQEAKAFPCNLCW